MQKILKKHAALPIKSFTLLESLLVLSVTVFLLLALTGSVKGILLKMQENLFFMNFEYLYRDTQKLSLANHQPMTLTVSEKGISNGLTELSLPETIKPQKEYRVHFDQAGGNSSLAKLVFETDSKTVIYQLYLGSGNYKKIENESLYSP
ncbi:competence type IV pilus minor pilin ComGD [Streptococcus sp. H49]|uniref:competence type IV pilus minor pilin ComGD n=1 Tax=Streptococcus huangxiaojuni TaxID=3237239 RepID=UPI0034A30842